jgi:succinoglycan biosynthesis protein ExoA
MGTMARPAMAYCPAPMPLLPFVTIAVPCLNEEVHIEACLRTVTAQDYPRDRMEILVADGGSTDRTRSILACLVEEDPRIVVIDNPARIQAAGLNEILRRAKGDVIVHADAHCEYAKNYVSKAIEALERTGADNVGGPLRPRGQSLFQRALCAALESPLGMGGTAHRSSEDEGYVDTVFLGAIRRRVFETVGLFDPGAVTEEDAELNQRILAAGGKVYLSKDLVVHYFPPGSFSSLARQYYEHGRGRARWLLKLRDLASPRPALPFLMVATGAALLATSRLHPLSPLSFGAYALATGFEAVRVGRKAGWGAVPVVGGIFPTMHVAHGIGFAAGLVGYGLAPDWAPPEILPPPEERMFLGQPAEA